MSITKCKRGLKEKGYENSRINSEKTDDFHFIYACAGYIHVCMWVGSR